MRTELWFEEVGRSGDGLEADVEMIAKLEGEKRSIQKVS
jgi:hypothetical protein